MILKRNFSPLKVWAYIQGPMLIVVIWSVLIGFIDYATQAPELKIPFSPIGVLGSALAIFVAFRNNAAYGRWWEARQIWAGILNSSRVLGRLIITFSDSHAHQENYDAIRSEGFKKSMINRSIAWAHSLRMELRENQDWESLRSFLSPSEYELFLQAQNKPNCLHLFMGQEIYRAMANGTLGGFDSFQMEGQLLALGNFQAAAEKIKQTPLPRQYDFFTRVFIMIFAFLLPFGLLSLFQSEAFPHISWFMIPFSMLISGVFIIMERTGAVNENPFENTITDVPMSSICNSIERDLKEMMGEKNLVPKLLPENGYLF